MHTARAVVLGGEHARRRWHACSSLLTLPAFPPQAIHSEVAAYTACPSRRKPSPAATRAAMPHYSAPVLVWLTDGHVCCSRTREAREARVEVNKRGMWCTEAAHLPLPTSPHLPPFNYSCRSATTQPSGRSFTRTTILPYTQAVNLVPSFNGDYICMSMACRLCRVAMGRLLLVCTYPELLQSGALYYVASYSTPSSVTDDVAIRRVVPQAGRRQGEGYDYELVRASSQFQLHA
jgi:hypothetical protein